jgi:hypothetical protein
MTFRTRKTYTVVENAGYEGECDGPHFTTFAAAAQWVNRKYSGAEMVALHVAIACCTSPSPATVTRAGRTKSNRKTSRAEVSGFSLQYISSLERGDAIQRSLPYTSYPWPLASMTSI